MYMLLALDSSTGINSFAQFSTVIIIIAVILFVILMIYLSPAQVLSRAIKEHGEEKNKEMFVASENKEYFKLDSGVRVFKRWYNVNSDCYICEYGTYIPIYNYNDEIISFIFIRK